MTVLRLPCLNTGGVLYIDGLLRAPMDREVRHQVRALLRRGERQIVLDLTRVSSIDAAGIGELVRAHNMTRAVNGTLRVANPTHRVHHAIECVGLDAFLLTGPATILRTEFEAVRGRAFPPYGRRSGGIANCTPKRT